MDGLIRALETLAEQSETLAADVRADAAQRRADDVRRQKVVKAALAVGLLLVLLIGAVLVIGWQHARITRQNNQLNQRVADCTTVGGECYERGAAHTGTAIDELVRANVHLHRCLETPGVDTDVEVMACLEKRMASRGPNR